MKRDFLKIFLAKIILNFAGIVALFQKIYNSLQQKQSQKAFLEKTSQNLESQCHKNNFLTITYNKRHVLLRGQ